MVAVSLLADGDRRRVNIEKLIEVARTTPASSLTTFTAYLEDLLKIEAREGEAPLEAGNTIRIMTVHRAKGLEFPLVVLPDLSRATPPSRDLWLHEKGYGLGLKLRNAGEWSETAAFRALQAEQQRRERAERERLAYVAMTRAQDYLILAGVMRQASGNDWLSWLLRSLDWSWEAGGPPNGMQTLLDGTLELHIQQHPIPNLIGTENPPSESL
jgi:ATP-dependent helicase/nuclease subunit A